MTIERAIPVGTDSWQPEIVQYQTDVGGYLEEASKADLGQ